MNNVVLIGRLTRDPELRYTPGPNNMAVANFTLAVDKKYSREKREQAEMSGQATADFIRCVAWGRLAENINNYIKKGQQLAIQGRIQTGSYQHKDGYTVYTTDVVVETADFIDWGDDNRYSYDQSSSMDQRQARPDPYGQGPSGSSHQDQYQSQEDESIDDIAGFYNVDNDDIPF